ncbi:MAG: TonB family protein [Bacteroidota bacterium]
MKIIFILLLSSWGFQLSAQSDTAYFNKSWVICSKKEAHFYRLVSKQDSLLFVRDYFISGQIQMTGLYVSLNPHYREGHFTFYHKSGRISSEGAYQHNEKTGIWKYYDSLGKIKFSENFLKGKRQGETLLYYPEGSVKRKEIYVDGKLSTGNCYTRSGQDTTYFAQSEEASFIGGQEALNSYIQENMRYPMGAVLRGIEGKVYVRFMINSNGQVKKIKIIKSAHRIFNSEVIRLFKQMPPWNPAKEEGVPVNFYVQMPINFTLN